MPGEKRFGTSLFGFNKADVNTYIEKILKEFDDKLKEKDDEIASLKNQSRDYKQKFEELYQKADQINEDRAKIANVLIKAEGQAQAMLEEARAGAMEERNKLEEIIEQEKEKLVDIRQEVKDLKAEVIGTLRKYESQLSVIIDEELQESQEQQAG